MQFQDTATLDGAPRETGNGYMVATVRAGRIGVQDYAGHEVGRPDLATVRVFRGEDEVFAASAMASAAHRPMTVDHPGVTVDATNWREHAVGFTGGEVARDGDYLRLPLMLADATAIREVGTGKRELSFGYDCALDWTPGTAPDGQTYDARQTGIRINHLAIVDKGRAGPACRIGDSSNPKEGQDMNVRTVTVDGLSIQTTDQGAQALEKLQGQLADAASKLTSRDGQIAALTSAHEKALGSKDGEIATLRADHAKAIEAKDGEIAGLSAKVSDTVGLDAMIAAREATIAGARRILGDAFDPKGQTDATIRRAAVVKRLGDVAVNGKSDDYVQAAFDTLTATAAKADPVRDAFRGGLAPVAPVGDARTAAHEEMTKGLTSGWQSGQGAR